MSRPATVILYALAGVALFAAVFAVSWFAAFFVLYEYVYGDSYGGRWVRFAFPVALAAAAGAVAMFLSHVTGRRRVGWRVAAGGVLLLLAATAVWFFVAATLLMPRSPVLPGPPREPRPQTSEAETEASEAETAHEAVREAAPARRD